MNQRAFTLVEILVVIAVIGLLSSIIFATTAGSREQAQIAKTLQWSRNIQSLLGADAVGIWNLDEDPAVHDTVIADLSGWGNNGTLKTSDGATNKSVPGVVNNALSFDGVNDYVDCGSPDDYPGIKTFEIWWNRQGMSIDQTYHVHRLLDGNNGDYGLNLTKAGRIKIIYRDAENNLSEAYYDPPSISDWYHIVGTFEDDDKARLYVNGELKGTSNAIGDIYWSGNYNLIIMGGSTLRYVPGIADEARVYDRALTIAQIESQYYAGLNRLLAKNLIDKQEYRERLAMLY